jgi:hypothetical protein
MKSTLKKNAHIVTFFNSSHYWGGQLKALAKSLNVTRGLVDNSETRWYTVILQALSILYYHIGS